MSIFRQRSESSSDSPPAKIAHSNSTATAASANASNPEAPSTVASSSHRRFGLSEIAHMFIRLRRHQSRATLASQARRESQEGTPAPESTTSAPETTGTSPLVEALIPAQAVPLPHPTDDTGRLILNPPAQPSRNRVRRLTGELTRSPYARGRSTSASKLKPHHIVSASGDAPITQPGIRESMLPEAPRIPVTYTDRFEVAGGVNTATLLRVTKKTILETIENMGLGVNAVADEKWECTICGPKNKNYKVQIDYSATAVRCTRQDGFRPVALDRVKSVPGLMTIVKRNDV